MVAKKRHFLALTPLTRKPNASRLEIMISREHQKYRISHHSQAHIVLAVYGLLNNQLSSVEEKFPDIKFHFLKKVSRKEVDLRNYL